MNVSNITYCLPPCSLKGGCLTTGEKQTPNGHHITALNARVCCPLVYENFWSGTELSTKPYLEYHQPTVSDFTKKRRLIALATILILREIDGTSSHNSKPALGVVSKQQQYSPVNNLSMQGDGTTCLTHAQSQGFQVELSTDSQMEGLLRTFIF